LIEKRRLVIETEEFIPTYGSELAAGFDLRAYLPEGPVTIKPNERLRIPTGIKMVIEPGYEVQLRSRSGLSFKHGLVVNQGNATIDADFRGEVGILLRNVSDTSFEIEHGMRLVQGVLAPVVQAQFTVVDKIKIDTERGEGAYGSTGVK
jgi:dUTP pyrophosphatase